MRVTTAIDRSGVTIHTMNPVHGKGPVFFASLTGDRKSCKAFLISTLWDHLLVLQESTLGKRCQSSGRAVCKIRVYSSPLGRPRLLLGEVRGPAISFSMCGGKVWAALCGDGSDIGIDVAGADEFQRDYPYQRVFHLEELEHALKLTGGVLDMASALLWSIKEAVVKALGCAFHLVDPLQITVHPLIESSGGAYTFPVGLSGKALVRFPLAGGRSLRVRSIPQDSLWLSIALVTRGPAGHE